MDINLVWMLLGVACACSYLGFSKDKFASVFFGAFGSAAFILAGYGIMTQIAYIGWISTGVDIYTLEADSANAAGHTAVGAFFALFGIIELLFTFMIFIFGEDQKKPGEIVDKVSSMR